jgi:hypothetical protein
MNSNLVNDFLEEQGVHLNPTHAAAAASTITSLLNTTAERFAKLPLEAEPSGFQAELRRSAP